MLDIKFIREHPEIVRADLRKRGDAEKEELLESLIELDINWRELKQQLDNLRSRRNNASKEINELKKQGKHGHLKQILDEIKGLPDRIKRDEEKEAELASKIKGILMRIPNILHESVPIGKDSSENVVVKTWGKPKKFGFELANHGELAEQLGVADFKRAAKIAGAGFAYLKGELALLDLALQRFAINHLMKKGFTLIEPPFMMNKAAYEGVTDLADFKNVMYKIEGEDLYLIATSEHPMVSMYMNEVLDEIQLPIKMCGVSPCFRKEIGSHGVDTRGVFRMHQFNKVEQVVICEPEDSWKIHEEIQRNSEELFEALEIPYRVVNICTGDIGIVAAKKYDIEAWFPREEKYSEVTSASNCTAYQAVRLNLRYLTGDKKEYVHTLNNTGIATSRAMRAILENYQNKDGTVNIPKVLVPYMNGMDVIGKK